EMAADERDYLGRAQPKWSHGADGFVLDRLGLGPRFNFSDRPLWSLRDEAGLQLFGRQTRRTAAIQNADVVSNGASSTLSRIHHCLLGHAKDDHRASLLRDHDHGLHSRRHSIRRARSDSLLRRQLSKVPRTSVDVVPAATAKTVTYNNIRPHSRRRSALPLTV